MADNIDVQASSDEARLQRKHHWSIWLSRFALFLGVSVIGIAVIGAVGAGERWWGQGAGIQALVTAFFLALAVIVFAIAILFYYRKQGARIFWASISALILAAGYVGYIGLQIPKATANPLHDVSTNLTNPPRFATLEARADNLKDIPGKEDPKYRGMDALERWRAIHGELYPDLRTLHVFQPVGLAIQRAEVIARENEWEIAMADPINGRLEATDTVALQQFKDDIIVRAIPDSDGAGSLIDIRSVSRYGQSDLGVNAGRVREFSAQLLEQLGGEMMPSLTEGQAAPEE